MKLNEPLSWGGYNEPESQSDFDAAYEEARNQAKSAYRYALKKAQSPINSIADQVSAIADQYGDKSRTVAEVTRSPEELTSARVRPSSGGGAPLIFGAKLHNTQPGHNKEYNLTVSEPAPGLYKAEASWGKIGGTLQSQVKYSGSSELTAMDKARDLIREKTAKGYVEVQTWHIDERDREELTKSADWEHPDDETVDMNQAAESAGPKEEVECTCEAFVQEQAWGSYVQPEPASVTTAPLLTQPGYGLLKFEEMKQGPRWVVGVVGSCSAGYQHARAVPVGPEPQDDALKPSKAAYIESLVENALRPERAKEYDHVLVVEEHLLELVVVDVVRWEGQDYIGESFLTRYQWSNDDWSKWFASDALKWAPLTLTRLREEFLGDGMNYRFELHDLNQSNTAWILPQLEEEEVHG